MSIPQDPCMLLSMLNMKLRDDDFENLRQLCDSIGADLREIEIKLQSIGYRFNESTGKIEPV